MKVWKFICVSMFATSCGNPSVQQEQPNGSLAQSAVISESTISTTEKKASKPIKIGNGPFGIAPGTPIEELDGEVTGRPGFYLLKTVPKPHPDIENVVVQAFPETGVCLVRGVGKSNDDDGYGTTTRTVISRVADQVSDKYGAPASKIDRCLRNYECDAEYWAMHIGSGDRAYIFEWRPTRDGVEKIYVAAGASSLTPYMIIEYYFDNFPKCEEAEKKVGAESL